MKRLSYIQIDEITELLLSEYVGVYPFDTIFGFIGIVTPAVEKKIASIKNRQEGHPFLMLVDSLESARKWVDIPCKFELFVKSVWPGPVTLVFRKKDNMGSSNLGTLAIRIPADMVLRTLIQRVGGAIYSTSVNVSGEHSCLTESTIPDSIKKCLDFFVTADDKLSNRVASTIVDCTFNTPIVLRNGDNVKGVLDMINCIEK